MRRAGAELQMMTLLPMFPLGSPLLPGKVLPLYHGTNAIVRLFTDTSGPAKFLRGAALRLGNVLTPVRKQIEKQLTEIQV